MRPADVISQIFFIVSLLVYTGCEPLQVDTKSPAQNKASYTGDCKSYAPAKIDIMPLTEFTLTAKGTSKLTVYLSLLDTFNCQMKSPGVFRFELYERVVRSAEPKGRRIILWPDIDLTNADRNNHYWRDFLRAYEFDLDCDPQITQSCILQATFLSPDGRRLSAEFAVKGLSQ